MKKSPVRRHKTIVLDAGVLSLYFAGRREAREYVNATYKKTARFS